MPSPSAPDFVSDVRGPLSPLGATSLAATSGNVTAATATATLAGAANVTTYITSLEITGAGATVGAAVTATVTGLLGGTQSYTVVAATGAAVANPSVIVQFIPPHPASAVNTAIVVSCPSLGAGNTNNVVNARGFRL